MNKQNELWEYMVDEKRLTIAWKKVEGNHGSPGHDGMSVVRYAEDIRLHLAALRSSLMEGTYQPGQVRLVTIHEFNKDREIAILNVEDRVVHQAIYQILNPIIEPILADSVYGFRPKRSAKSCVQDILLHLKQYSWVFETDIMSFFDTIPIVGLMESIRPYVSDERLYQLIRRILESHWKYGVFGEDRVTGILQGSPLSPLLSNLYLLPLDNKMRHENIRYYRYADDLIALGTKRTEVQRAAYFVTEQLRELKLQIKIEKTRFKTIAEGFEFLGFTINEQGSAVSSKAVDHFHQMLNDFLLNARGWEPKAMLTQLESMIRGWGEYYGEPAYRAIHGFPVWLAFLNFYVNKGYLDSISRMMEQIPAFPAEWWGSDWNFLTAETFVNIDYRLAAFMLIYPLAMTKEATQLLLRLFPIDIRDRESMMQLLYQSLSTNLHVDEGQIKQILEWSVENQLFWLGDEWNRLLNDDQYDGWTDVFAEFLEKSESVRATFIEDENWNDEEIKKLMELFRGRDDRYAVEHIDKDQQRGFFPKMAVLDQEVWRKHLKGEWTVGQYLVTKAGTVHYALLDVDIQKNKWVMVSGIDEERQKWLQRAFNEAIKIYHAARQLAVAGYLEESGRRGYHVWFFFEEAIPMGMAYEFFDRIFEMIGKSEEFITVERFPNSKQMRENQLGQLIKLPFGIHHLTGNYSKFVQENGKEDRNFHKQLHQLSKIPRQQLWDIITSKNHLNDRIVAKGSDANSPLLDERIHKVVEGCQITKYMINKAQDTHFLSHEERLFLLRVFRAFGEVGEKYLHIVIGHCMDYRYDVTEKYIRKMTYSNPVSCEKTREKFPEITQHLSCKCRFPLQKNQYASPIVHSGTWPSDAAHKAKGAVASAMGSVSSTQKSVPTGLASREEIELLVKKISEFNRQKRGIQKALDEAKTQLDRYFLSETGVYQSSIILTVGELKREVKDDGEVFYWIAVEEG